MTPRHLRLPGILASLFKAVQSKKALLPVYLGEGGIASSIGAAQFMKALTWIVESGRKEHFSEASAVHKGEFRNFFNSGVAKVYTLEQTATVTRMRSNSSKMLWKSSLVLACSVDPRGDGISHKVTAARLMHP